MWYVDIWTENNYLLGVINLSTNDQFLFNYFTNTGADKFIDNIDY